MLLFHPRTPTPQTVQALAAQTGNRNLEGPFAVRGKGSHVLIGHLEVQVGVVLLKTVGRAVTAGRSGACGRWFPVTHSCTSPAHYTAAFLRT